MNDIQLGENQLVINDLEQMKNYALRLKDRKKEMDEVKFKVGNALENLMINFSDDDIATILRSLEDAIKTETNRVGELFEAISNFVLQQMSLYAKTNAAYEKEVQLLRQQLELEMK